MKQLAKILLVLAVSCIFLFTSCKKENFCQACIENNKVPVAAAGPDTAITLPMDSTLLDGSKSNNPDGKISTWLWTKIAGPASFAIVNATAAKTIVKNLVEGVYQFELKVTNAEGLFAKDTVQVTINTTGTYTCGDTNRPIINAQLIPVGTLSQTRDWVTVASAGNKILFAGGIIPAGTHSSRVDIYDLTTHTLSTTELSEARSGSAAIAAGNKIFFAGGDISDGTFPTKTVDIYDVATSTWTKTALSMPGVGIAASVVGNKVLFGGGDAGFSVSWPASWERTSRVDIYDLVTNSWSTSSFSSVKRGEHAAVTINNKVYFSGGETWPPDPFPPVPGTWYASNTIEVYDNETESWSTSFLAKGRLNHAGIAVDDKIFWAGGETGSFPSITGSCSVEIHNVITGNVSIQKLSSPGPRTAVMKNNQIIFYAGTDKFDIYDLSMESWSIGVLPVTISGGSIISVNNTIYLAGGRVNGALSNKIYRLEF